MRVRRGPDERVGITTTDARGRFRFGLDARPGSYRAVAPRENDPQGECLATESAKVTVPRRG